MGEPLKWKPNEGFDIHLLRDGPASKRLIDAIDLGGAQAASVTFIPQGNVGTAFGIEVDPAGAVKAGLHPDPSTPKVTNFLLLVVGNDAAGEKSQTIIRIHIHDGLDAIWLTPTGLAIHKDDNGCRFTVLAKFDDGVVGDITDWQQISYRSAVPNTTPAQDSADILVSSAGLLTALTPGKTATITAQVNLMKESRPTELLIGKTSDPVTVLAKESWVETAAIADFNFIVAALRPSKEEKDKPKKSGTVLPNKDDPKSDKRDSVKSVVENAMNVLFIAEGFSQEQRGDFNDYVWKIAEHMRTDVAFQPFKLLKDSVNYWSVFLPSGEKGISLLGDYYSWGPVPNKQWTWSYQSLPLPKEPDASAAAWSLEEMIYEVGLPTPAGPEPFDLHAIVRDYWRKIYGDHVTEDRVANFLSAWWELAGHQPLNECNSAFGMRNQDRTRATPTFGQVMLGSDPRRATDTHIREFISNLTYGKDPASGETQNVGETWNDGKKDFGRICFICQTEKHSGINWGYYFLTSTGRNGVTATVPKVARQGLDIDTPPVETMGRTLLASIVSHELGHSLSLGDEYGDGAAGWGDINHSEPNLQAKSIITSITADLNIIYDKTKDIKWEWPRLVKAGVLDQKPGRSLTGFYVPLRKGHGKSFRVGDLVRFREWPVHNQASKEPFVAFQVSNGFVFKVKVNDDDGIGFEIEGRDGHVVDVASPNASSNLDPRSWGDILSDMFEPDKKYALICPLSVSDANGTAELRLVSEVIRSQIAKSNGPLNAPPGNESVGFETAKCGANYYGTMTPTNLPRGFKLPGGLASSADLIGIYEGGGGHDCGVFRPAGRCKMRDSDDTTIPYCSVCRYVIVDWIDPTKHGELDAIYARQYPK